MFPHYGLFCAGLDALDDLPPISCVSPAESTSLSSHLHHTPIPSTLQSRNLVLPTTSVTNQFAYTGRVLRSYQIELARPGVEGRSYVICAPTGSGKTAVAAFVICEHLKMKQGVGKVMFLVNKVPLAEQQKKEIEDTVSGIHIAALTGDSGAPLRTMLNHNDVIVCTAGIFLNALTEMRTDYRVKWEEVSLLVIDECHNTKKNAPYARIMLSYLKKKFGRRHHVLPQVVGLTATPGAGDVKQPDLFSAVGHMVKLCAHLDAAGGIKVVEECRQELVEHTQKADLNLVRVPPRKYETEFMKILIQAMEKIEQSIHQQCQHPRSAQGYENWVVQLINDAKLKERNQDRLRLMLSALNHLRWYSVALLIYEDLNEMHTIQVLEDELKPTMPLSAQAMPYEKVLEDYYHRIVEVGKKEQNDSPQLDRLARLLRVEFTKNPDCQGIVFCRTKHHARCLCNWMKTHPDLQAVKAEAVTGHTREGDAGMTKAEQTKVIDDFRHHKLNLIVATTVLEEGFDVPACNLVIRLHVTNEIARKQAHGRARAEESQCFTILTAGSKREFQELENKERESIAECALEYLPKGDSLMEQMTEYQQELLAKKRAEMGRAESKRGQNDPATVRLLCGRCQEFACMATDVKTINEHYVVPLAEFQSKFIKRAHHKPVEFGEMKKNQKIACAKCNSDWGVHCDWTKRGLSYPVLKCSDFVFEISGQKHTFKKWNDVTFSIEELSFHRGILDESDSDSD